MLSSEFNRHGMLEGTTLSYSAMDLTGELPLPKGELEDSDDKDAELGPSSARTTAASVKLAVKIEPVALYPRRLEELSQCILQPRFPETLHHFLWEQLHPEASSSDIPV
ncbi:hypothetical protein BDQ17DRAFT_1431330 [Cyathus striatus]|nr:hypothetical protein BDQ17DRAFT_1431330 [Cyathus striatus]